MGFEPFVELLAPAGNIKAFIGAVHAGADALYLGGSRFGARAYAENFTEDEIVWCIRYAHLFGRKVYLTVNTLVKEAEFNDIFDFIRPFYEAGLDGVIVQDIGVLGFIRDNFPELKLHASTQMSITGVYGAMLVKKLGVSRVVPARELSLREIMLIRDKTGLEIESFIHGAMCYCYSGQCLFSSILGARSGNRGRCAQPCRLPYEVTLGDRKSKACYPLSLKDMCMLEKLPDLIEAGISSFKIEGRMKKPEYAAGVTAIYRKYIDMYLADRAAYKSHTKKWNVTSDDLESLSKIYIRSGMQSGYYYKHNGRDMVTLESPSYNGGDKALLDGIREKYIDNNIKYDIDIKAHFVKGEQAAVVFSCKDSSVAVYGDVVQPAQKQPLSTENIVRQLQKLGGTSFNAGGIEVNSDEDIFYPIGGINDLRRSAAEALERKIIEDNGFPFERGAVNKECHVHDGQEAALEEKTDCFCAVSVRTLEQLGEAVKFVFYKRLYIDADIFVSNPQSVSNLCIALRSAGKSVEREFFISLPYVIRRKDEAFLARLKELMEEYSELFSGIQVRGLDGLGYLLENKYEGVIYADAGLYIWNKRALSELKPYIDGFCIPYELKLSEQRSICAELEREKVIYGRLPMMITANCVINTVFNCMKGQNKTAFLTDRYGKVFPVVSECTHCMNIIYNSVPVSLHTKPDRLYDRTDFRIDFTVESASDTESILKYFMMLLKGDFSAVPPYQEYTTGHDRRGVE